MPGKEPSPIFKRRINAEEFIEKGTGLGVPAAEMSQQPLGSETPARPEDPPAVPLRQAAPESPHKDFAPNKPRKIAMTYKHREQNYKRLKYYSQKLEVSMGDLIDEALESKFPEWKPKLPPEPDY